MKESEGFLLDIIYTTNRNFMGKVLYDSFICILRKETKEKLVAANNEFKNYGYKIKIWDAFRPIIYQKHMWESFPDERFVARKYYGKKWFRSI